MTLPMMRRAAPGLTALLLGLIACVAGSPPRASAAAAPTAPAPLPREVLKPATEDQTLQTRTVDALAPPLDGPCPIDVPGLSFQLRAVKFVGASTAHTRDLSRATHASEALDYGMVGVNTGVISNEIGPFGGVKESGLGREGSRHGIDEYLNLKMSVFAV